MVEVKDLHSGLEARMNSDRDIVVKRCGCTRQDTGGQYAGHCPRLAEPGRGSWYYAVQVTTVCGRRARYRREASRPVRRRSPPVGRSWTPPSARLRPGHGLWRDGLRYWLALAEPNLRPPTIHGYRDHIDRYLIPSLGRITLADLSARRLQASFDLLARQRTAKGTPMAPSAVDRVRATLRSALNTAVREGLMASNPLVQVRVARPVRPHPVIWTDERIAAWRRDGSRPPVAVWTAQNGDGVRIVQFEQ
jgi:hypothetical protein